MPDFDWIAFDADDTLWHNEPLFAMAQDRFVELLAPYHDPQWIRDRLYETETRNLAHFGYGIKAFALSMLESAAELTEGRLTGKEVIALIDVAKEMLKANVELLPGVKEVVERLAKTHKLMVITKGDLLDQESKMNRSPLADSFRFVEVVSDKTCEVYARILDNYGVYPDKFLMIGNSIKSDILPALEIGAWALHVPYETTWLHEVAEPPTGHTRFASAASIAEVPEIVARLEGTDR